MKVSNWYMFLVSIKHWFCLSVHFININIYIYIEMVRRETISVHSPFLIGGAICPVNSDNERDSSLLNVNFLER